MLSVTLLTAGCARNIFTVHKIDIEQGNLLNEAAIDEISSGMSRKQVAALLGEPVLKPVLNPDRWDYVYYLKRPDSPAEKDLISIFFIGDEVTQIKKSQ